MFCLFSGERIFNHLYFIFLSSIAGAYLLAFNLWEISLKIRDTAMSTVQIINLGMNFIEQIEEHW